MLRVLKPINTGLLMSVHTVSELNALIAGLHNFSRSPTQSTILKWLLPKYKIGDYFVTLTFGEDYVFDNVRATSKVKLFLQKINRAVFGKAYDQKYKVLKSDFVFEQNASNGWHIHMLLEKPESNKPIVADLQKFILRTWVGINWNVVQKAQKVLVIDETLEKVIDYMTKQITKENQSQRLGVI